MSIVDQILSLPVPVLAQWGFLLVFILTFFESFPLFGMMVPGQAILLGAGFLVHLGILDMKTLLLLAFLATVLGDIAAYLIGKRYGHPFLALFEGKFLFSRSRIESTKKLVRQHPAKTLILGRFTSFTHAVAPFAAGLSCVKFWKFLAYTLFGSAVWSMTFVFLGYLFGDSYKIIARTIGTFIIIAIVASISIILFYRWVNRRWHVFQKIHLFVLMLNVLSIYLFFKALEDMLTDEFLLRVDILVEAKRHLYLHGTLTKLFISLTQFANTIFVIGLCGILLGYLLHRRRIRDSILLFLSLGGGYVLDKSIKLIVQRLRPADPLISISGYSFPSGHATLAMIFFGLMIYLFVRSFKKLPWRIGFIIINACCILAVGMSRVYLGVHWMSDVIAGFALGLFVLTFLILFLRVASIFAEKHVNDVERYIKKMIR